MGDDTRSRWLGRSLLLGWILCWTGFAAEPSGYYSGTNGLAGVELKERLHRIIRNHVVLPYSSGSRFDTSDALAELDADPADTNRVRLVYSSATLPRSQFGDTGGWNREHVWPNSYGIDSTGPAYSDLHHLFACDANVNSSRGNKFYDRSWAPDGSFREPAHERAVGSSTDRDSWQPPVGQRGDLARALLYMDLRYAGGVTGELDLELTDDLALVTTEGRYMGRLTTLLCWHLSDPVDDRERRRNDRVFALQGNRNPFVDHPEFVPLIHGDPSRIQPLWSYVEVEIRWPSVLDWQLWESAGLLEWVRVGQGVTAGKWENTVRFEFNRPMVVWRLQ